jgi:hypothetical protein
MLPGPLIRIRIVCLAFHHPVGIPPALIGYFRTQWPASIHGYMHYRPEHIYPNPDIHAYARGFAGYSYRSILQYQFLPHFTFQWIRTQPDPHPASLQQRIILIKSPALSKIEQQVPVFHPNIQADVAAAARHRSGRIPAGSRPYDIILIDIPMLGRQTHTITKNEEAKKYVEFQIALNYNNGSE